MTPDLSIDARLRAGDFRLDVNLEVQRGPVVLVGPNGSGKTTLLRALAGGPVQTDGRIVVRGRTWLDTARGICLPPEARRVGYMPQGYGLFPHLTAEDGVAYGAPGSDRGDRRRRARALLERLGVAHLAGRRPRRLSGGEQQRVALARALATGPDLLLLDEPTAALDVAVRRETRELLTVHLHDPARCAVAVTHDLRDLVAWAPTLAVVDDGRILDRGTMPELAARAQTAFLRELLAPLA